MSDCITSPTEDEMRRQMFQTMKALEQMADRVSDFFADKQPTTSEEPMTSAETAPLPNDLERINKMLNAHQRALAVISSFALFTQDAFMPRPKETIARLVGLRACKSCGGTGWLARDESCDECQMIGYLKV